MISMAALIGLAVTDTLMTGLASTKDLAALAIGSGIYFLPTMLLVGLMSVVAPRISWHLAAHRKDSVRHDCWQSIWLGLVVGGCAAVAVYFSLPLLDWLGLEPDVQEITNRYLLIVLFALPLVGAGQGLRSTIDGLGYPALNMWVSIAALLLNGLLDYLFVFGKAGFPKLGAQGCAIATLFVVILQTLAPVLIARLHPKLKPYVLFDRIDWPNFITIKRLLVLGVPAAVAITLEEGFFASSSFLVAPMGTIELATHQILLNIAMMALVFPIALGQAASILIGQELGRENPHGAYSQSWIFMGLLLLLMMLCGLGLYLGRAGLVSLFTEDAAVIAMAASILVLVSFQLLVDGLQIGSNIALKGYQDTFIPALCQVFSYWCVGFPLAWWLSRTDSFGSSPGVRGVWIALFTGLAVAAVLGVSRLAFVSREFASGRRQLR